MHVGYVVLYVNDLEHCLSFWVEKVGMVERKRTAVGELSVVEIGFPRQEFSFELVPLEIMKENPNNLDLATPSIAFRVDDLDATHERLAGNGVQVSTITTEHGPRSFALSDPEGRWFAVLS
jgi:catechol 2,3-dioxygenase-like lactoylglutathione lyase family enzyme